MTLCPDTSVSEDKSYTSFLQYCKLTEQDMLEAEKTVQYISETLDPPYEVRESTINRLGVFAVKEIDGIIGIFKSTDNWYTLGRYANHSSEPNSRVGFLNGNWVLAGTVSTGTEITVDYFQVKLLLDALSSVLVVDDFCEDLARVKESALAAGFSTWLPNKGEVGSSVYEGMGFWGDHSLLLRSLILSTGKVLVPNSMFFRVTNEGMEKAYIHSDRESGNNTCVVYLTEHDTASGTAFFRHKRTGLLHMPSIWDMHNQGILEELKSDMVTRDPTKWEQVGYVEGKYNRALIFDAPLFHSRFPLEGIGDAVDTGRLIWATHFNFLNGKGQFY